MPATNPLRPADQLSPNTISAKRLGAELSALIVLGAVITAVFVWAVYPAMGLSGTAPVPARSLALLAAITWIFSRNRERWAGFGLRWSGGWWQIPAAAIALLVLKVVVLQPAADFLADAAGAGPSDHSFFRHIHQNAAALALWLAIAWCVGGFAEEMIFRGYLTGRLSSVLGGGKVGWLVAVLAQAALFGAGHAYLGTRGMISAFVSAMGYGLWYLACRRTLWPVILAHGLWDSIGVTLVYLKGSTSV